MNLTSLSLMEYLDYAVMVGFLWVGLACLVNVAVRKNVYWFTGMLIFAFLLFNRLFDFNGKFAAWFGDYNKELIAKIDEVAPGLLIYDTLSTWVMFIIGIFVFIQVAYLLSHLTYRRFSYFVGGIGLTFYILAAGCWLCFALCRVEFISSYTPSVIKDSLLVTGSMFMVVSFLLGLQPTRVNNYAENYE